MALPPLADDATTCRQSCVPKIILAKAMGAELMIPVQIITEQEVAARASGLRTQPGGK